MRPKTVILMGVAIVCGLVAALLVSMATQAKQGPEMVTVLVAAEELRQGTVLNNLPKQIVQTQLPRDAVPPGALTDKKQLENMQVLRTLDKGQVPTPGTVGKYEGLAKRLRPGFRAFTIRVSMDTALAGFILPGAKVDLLCNLTQPNGKNKISKIFMQDMEVLAVNAEDVPKDQQKTIGNPSVVTLEVTPQQAEQLNLVSSLGDVRLILRKPDDRLKVTTPGTSDPLMEGKGAEGEADVACYVAARQIDANEPVTDENFDQLFSLKKFTKSTAPANPVIHPKEIKDAKFVYVGIGAGVALSKFNLTKPEKTGEPGKGPVAVAKLHELTIYNGSQPVIKVGYRGNVGTASTEAQPGVPDAPPAPAVPGSEGK